MKYRARFYLFLVFSVFLLSSQRSMAELVLGEDGEIVADLGEEGLSPQLLAESILGEDVEVFNVKYSGEPSQAGYVSGFDILGLSSEQIILSTGDALNIIGPNDSDATSLLVFDLNTEDEDFLELNGGHYTRDESIIELDFIPPPGQNQLVIEYVFGSDEYGSDEYGSDTSMLAGEQRDFMAIFVNGINCAVVPDGDGGSTKVGVASINNELNADLYIDNVRTGEDELSPYNSEMDGFTTVLKCSVPVLAGEVNHLEFGVVDASPSGEKSFIDSWILIKSIHTDYLLDEDHDGLPNYADLDDDGNGILDEDEIDETPSRAVGGSGSGDERVKVGVDGVGAFNPGLLGLFMLSIVWRAGTRLKVQLSRLLFVSVFGLFALGFVPFGQNGQAFAGGSDEDDLYEGFYVGASLGLSSLEPDTRSTPYSLDEDGGPGFKIIAGYDLLDQLSVEAALAYLGKAELSPSADIEYRPFSLSGVYHVLGQRSRSVFIKAGLATLNVSSNISVEEQNDYQFMLGLGGEWALKKGWSLRAEIESYDEDASQYTFGVVKRFTTKSSKVVAQNSNVVLPKKESCPGRMTESGCIVPPIAEQEKSCAIVADLIENIQFEFNKAEITPSAHPVLDAGAIVLKDCPSFKVEIKAYADNVGSDKDNLALSRLRANAVRLYMIAIGIAPSRLVSEGYGEKDPVADNATEEGRALNRRVEFNLKEVDMKELISSDE